jgi:hypothetical protein
MGFRIFAAGTKGFHFVKDHVIDGSEFETIKVVAILQTMELSKLGVVGAVIDHQAPGITDLMVSLATKEFLHNLNNAVSFLAMKSGASNGWIAVSSTQKNTLWADTVSFAKYDFRPGNSPGAEFIKKIGPGLKETDMNNFGVLMALGIVLSKYSNHISDSDTPMINIQLSH